MDNTIIYDTDELNYFFSKYDSLNEKILNCSTSFANSFLEYIASNKYNSELIENFTSYFNLLNDHVNLPLYININKLSQSYFGKNNFQANILEADTFNLPQFIGGSYDK